jgi:hypothetical protein
MVLFGEEGLLPSSSLLPLSVVLTVLTVSRSFFWTALGSSFSLSSRGRGSRYPMEEEQRLPSLGLRSVHSDKGVKFLTGNKECTITVHNRAIFTLRVQQEIYTFVAMGNT